MSLCFIFSSYFIFIFWSIAAMCWALSPIQSLHASTVSGGVWVGYVRTTCVRTRRFRVPWFAALDSTLWHNNKNHRTESFTPASGTSSPIFGWYSIRGTPSQQRPSRHRVVCVLKAVAQGADNFLDYIMSSYVPKKFSSYSLKRRKDEMCLRKSCGTTLRAYILSELIQIIIVPGLG